VAVAALQTVGAVVVVVVELGNRSIGCGSGRCDIEVVTLKVVMQLVATVMVGRWRWK
jgi:hypothetical protein